MFRILFLALQLAASQQTLDKPAIVSVALVQHLEQPGVAAVVLRRVGGDDVILLTPQATSDDLAEAVREYRKQRLDAPVVSEDKIYAVSSRRVGSAAGADKSLLRFLRSKQPRLVLGVGRVPVIRINVPLEGA
jgi:hypothetical protein